MRSIILISLAAVGLALPQHDHSSSSSAAASATTTTAPTAAPTVFTPMVVPPAPPGFPEDWLMAPKIASVAVSPYGEIATQRFGPYTAGPGKTVVGLATGVKNPCTKTCYVTAFEADLVYPNGTVANVDTGAWLHHMVLGGSGASRSDLLCPFLPLTSRMFASGNERTTSRMDVTVPFGIKLNPGDTMGFIYELMNEGTDTKQLYITTKLEYTSYSEYREAKLIWLDVTGGCGVSSVPAQLGVYQLKTPVWTSTVNGVMLVGGGHLHDGGDRIDIYKNGVMICSSRQLYGMSPAFLAHGHGTEDHSKSISNSGGCRDLGRIVVGDKLHAIAYYNTTAHPVPEHSASHPVMGIANIWVGLD